MPNVQMCLCANKFSVFPLNHNASETLNPCTRHVSLWNKLRYGKLV